MFASENYYPSGGMDDLIFVGSLDACKSEGMKFLEAKGSSVWAHIADLGIMEVALESRCIRESTRFGVTNTHHYEWVTKA